MFARIRIIFSVFGLISILTACGTSSAVEAVTPLSPTLEAPITVTPQAGLSFDCQDSQEIPVEECQALLALYASTNGDHWEDNSGWLIDESLCTWIGVICEQGHITELQLYYNNLTGSLPPEIGNLTQLKSLYLDDNQLSGPLPRTIGNLKELRLARLGKNQFSSIPAELADLEHLITLELWGNQLTGEIPSELANLSSLQELRLNYNQFTGSIPPELGNLKYLHYLDLSHNQLSGSIPGTLGNLRSLHWLDLSFNQLTGSIPAELEELANLGSLNLSYNQLTGTVPVSLKKPMWEVKLWGNSLDGTIQASEDINTIVEYEGVKFEFDSVLGESVWPEVRSAQPPFDESSPGWEVKPEHIQFTFAYPREFSEFEVWGTGTSGPPYVMIFPTQMYSTMSEPAKGEIEALRTLLETPSLAPEKQMPLLPLINAAQIFHVQVKYVDFQNGTGVRFITHYSQDVGPIVNQRIFYSFQGLTDDGAYYVAAYFPLSATGLGNDPAPEDWESFIAHYQDHVTETVSHLDSLSSNDFEPGLDKLDRMITSLVVNPP
ncbi:MAG TPA: leucine-rich repeat domain-containing protein [Anaerolineales bacterium]|nr:leucine-rich repeat domain-containing protein [Anaerolineales bacterium]